MSLRKDHLVIGFSMCVGLLTPLLSVAEDQVEAGQSSLSLETAFPVPQFHATFQAIDFNSMVAKGSASSTQHFAENYAFVQLDLPNKDAVSLLAEYDIDYLDHSQDSFWNTEIRYNWRALHLAEGPNWLLESKLNSGVDLPTSGQEQHIAGLQGGAIVAGSLILTSQHAKFHQTYRLELEGYRYLNSQTQAFNAADGRYDGSANFEMEFHEKVNALIEYQKFWAKLELKHYDFVQYLGGSTAVFRHWESIGYHLNPTYALEVGQAYRGDLVGVSKYSNYLSFTDADRSLFVLSLIVSL